MLRPALAVLLLAATAAAGTASAAPGRTAEASYAGPALSAPRVGPLPAVTVLNRRLSGASVFETVPRERTLRVSLSDDSGAPVGARVTQTVGTRVVELGAFCGTSRPLRIAAPGQPVRVAVSAACGTPTTGSMRVTFR